MRPPCLALFFCETYPFVVPHFCLLAEDPDVEDAPVVPPEMGTIELRAYRIRVARKVAHRPSAQYGLHRGHVSERSKKAGWHHVR